MDSGSWGGAGVLSSSAERRSGGGAPRRAARAGDGVEADVTDASQDDEAAGGRGFLGPGGEDLGDGGPWIRPRLAGRRSASKAASRSAASAGLGSSRERRAGRRCRARSGDAAQAWARSTA